MDPNLCIHIALACEDEESSSFTYNSLHRLTYAEPISGKVELVTKERLWLSLAGLSFLVKGFYLGVGEQGRMGQFSLYLILAAVPEFILSPLVRK